ncbi:Na+/H+ antiporter [Nakamurella sp. A5-74]|uniref:Na+/H+ antiporter n=1 Tax=Nakamurella sp. A5-74 TaxID=3158264 RepID=A0AAU8DRM1_9ACTN
MDVLALVVALVIGVVALTPLADAIRIPQPVLLTVFGLLLALLPFTPELAIEPEIVLPVVLPPLLFAATQRTSAREFRNHATAVLTLAVGLTLATVAVVAVVAHALGVPWIAAWVLGAIVSPPDPVAATAVARRLQLPGRLVTILEGEGMFNDATALVAFKVTLAAAVGGGLSWGGTLLELALAVGVGGVVGLALGWLATRALGRIHDSAAETTITLLVPYLGYVGAERFGGSGVLAVLVLGLYLTTFSHGSTTSEGWLLGRSVWSYVDFLLTSLVFALLGFELVKVIGQTSVDGHTVVLALVVAITLIFFRFVWIFPAVALVNFRARRRDAQLPANWRESVVVSWAGMRGVVTVAGALSIPLLTDVGDLFPDRSQVVVVSLTCVLLTLVLQGLTLGPLASQLGVGGSSMDAEQELVVLRRRAAEAALHFIRRSIDDDAEGVPTTVRQAVLEQYEGLIASQQALQDLRAADLGRDVDAAGVLTMWMRRASDAERTFVIDARRQGQVSPEVADDALREIEGRARRAGY